MGPISAPHLFYNTHSVHDVEGMGECAYRFDAGSWKMLRTTDQLTCLLSFKVGAPRAEKSEIE